MPAKTQRVSAAKVEERIKALETAKPWDDALFGQFIRASAIEIVQRIEAREWTASEVLEAYIARTAYAQNLTNCVTEVMFEQARARAKELDQEFERTGTPKGPLHGVPTSFKDLFDFVGVDSSLGYSQWVGKKVSMTCDLATILVEAGAIPFVKTNVPQTMYNFECRNPVWGRTTNPYSEHYTSGGSSGGEGALLGMDGSALGLGTDIGGSLRIPALYCGIYSLKPGSNRVSLRGASTTCPGFEGIKTVAGPMGRSVDDLIAASKVIFGAGSDPMVAPLPYREHQLQRQLKIGYYTYDGYVKASPACQRAVLESVEALRKTGHDCVEFSLPERSALRATEIFVATTSADGYHSYKAPLGPDPVDSANFLPFLGPRLPGFIRSAAVWILATILKEPVVSATLRHSSIKSTKEYVHFVDQRNHLADVWQTEVWDKHGFDGIIGPVQTLPQVPHGGFEELAFLASSTILYNVVDNPAGVLPVTHVDPEKDRLTDEWKAKEVGSPLLAGFMYKDKGAYYDLEKLKGMPIGVQVIGKKWEDEKVLAMMKVLDEALGKRGFGPGGWDTKQTDSKD